MQLIPILLNLACALFIFSAFIILIGSRKTSRIKPVLFFFALISSAVEIFGVQIKYFDFFGLEKNANIIEPILVISSIVAVLCLLLIIEWLALFGKNRHAKGWRIIFLGSTLLGFSFCTTMLPDLFGLSGVIFQIIAIDLFFYAVLRYKIFDLSNKSLKIWSYSILAFLSIVSYIVAFYFITKYLFHVESSTEILALNLVMIIIIVIIWPIIREVNIDISSLIQMNDVNFSYIIKRLNKMATQNVKIKDLAIFLADYLHFSSVSFIINGRFYSSDQINIKKDQIFTISRLSEEKNSIWQNINGESKNILEKNKIQAVAKIRDAKGRPFGQILIGKPAGKTKLEKRDLVQIEKILNIIASIIDSKERLRK